MAVTVSGEAAEKVTGPDVARRSGPCGGALSIVRRGGPYYYCTDSSTATIGGLHAPIYATFLIHNSELSPVLLVASNSFSSCLNCFVAQNEAHAQYFFYNTDTPSFIPFVTISNFTNCISQFEPYPEPNITAITRATPSLHKSPDSETRRAEPIHR